MCLFFFLVSLNKLVCVLISTKGKRLVRFPCSSVEERIRAGGEPIIFSELKSGSEKGIYKPVSVMSVPGKVMEQILLKETLRHVEDVEET